VFRVYALTRVRIPPLPPYFNIPIYKPLFCNQISLDFAINLEQIIHLSNHATLLRKKMMADKSQKKKESKGKPKKAK
jgi:hypothetical protein